MNRMALVKAIPVMSQTHGVSQDGKPFRVTAEPSFSESSNVLITFVRAL